MKTVEIICSHCGADALLQREAVYEGLAKVGERLLCSSCGHEYANEAEVPFKARTAKPALFGADDRPEQPRLFQEGENRSICRYCAHYVVNPFTQFCAVHKKQVQATDSCQHFSERSDGEEGSEAVLF